MQEKLLTGDLGTTCDFQENFTTIFPKNKNQTTIVTAHFSNFSNGATAPTGPGPPHYRGFTITFRHTALGRTPLHEWSARRRDLYLTTHNTHKRQTSMPPAGFEPTVPASERPQTHAIHRAATGIGISPTVDTKINYSVIYAPSPCAHTLRENRDPLLLF
jgi:hypothetical protein